MIQSSYYFKMCFQDLYYINRSFIKEETSFDDVFKSNKTRLEFINFLFDEYVNHRLSYEGEHVFEKHIDFIYSFMNGKEKERTLSIPKKYFNDSSLGAIIPTLKEVEYLLKIIEHNDYMFKSTYENNPLYLKLPDDTFNQNMTRILEIKRHNIAHLLGLTEHEDPNEANEQKNLLKKHFNSIVKDKTIYPGNTDAEKLLSWLVSKEGKEEIRRIHKITLAFINKDRIKNPQAYNGIDLKSDERVITKFKERYKKETGLDYPIINYSRLIIKSINALNFFKLNNLVEVILDYNAPKGKKNEKDIFLVNRNSRRIHEVNNEFIDKRMDLILDLYGYANNPNNQDIKVNLLENGININSPAIKDVLNILKAEKFIEKQGITPDMKLIEEKIINAINDSFQRDIHLIGFATDFGYDKEIPLNKKVIHHTHCDTAISLTAPELLGEYYRNGRSFFLDKLDSKKGILMVSNINDEIYYLKRMTKIKKDAEKDCKELIKEKNKLKLNYQKYLQPNYNRR